MKITKENYIYLQTAINNVLAEYPNISKEYETGQFPRADRVKDLQKRFCFDLLFGAGVSQWVSQKLYSDNAMNDEHIYTALRSICPTVTKRY